MLTFCFGSHWTCYSIVREHASLEELHFVRFHRAVDALDDIWIAVEHFPERISMILTERLRKTAGSVKQCEKE